MPRNQVGAGIGTFAPIHWYAVGKPNVMTRFLSSGNPVHDFRSFAHGSEFFRTLAKPQATPRYIGGTWHRLHRLSTGAGGPGRAGRQGYAGDGPASRMDRRTEAYRRRSQGTGRRPHPIIGWL